MNEPVETIETNKGTLEIHYDDEPRDMLDFDTLGTIYHWYKGMNLGTRVLDPEEIPRNGFRLPVYMYSHSGDTVSTTPFGCSWDSGQVGWIQVSEEKAKHWLNVEEIDEKWKKKILDVLNAEVEHLARVLEGNVYGYVLKGPPPDPCPHCGHQGEPEEEDSCWGFVGELDEVIEDMLWSVGAKRKAA